MTPINKILQVKLRIVRWKDFPAANQAFRYWRTLLKEAVREPTTARELGHGRTQISGLGRCVWIGCCRPLDTSKRCTGTNNLGLGKSKEISGQADNSDKPREGLEYKDLEMVGKLLEWLMLEGIVGTKNLRYKHFGLFIDNTAAVSWTQIGSEKKSASTGRLLRVVAFRQWVARASPLVAAHVAEDLNVLADIPSRSFGYSKQWYCTNNYEFLTLIIPNSHFLVSILGKASVFPSRWVWKLFPSWGQRHIQWESRSDFVE